MKYACVLMGVLLLVGCREQSSLPPQYDYSDYYTDRHLKAAQLCEDAIKAVPHKKHPVIKASEVQYVFHAVNGKAVPDETHFDVNVVAAEDNGNTEYPLMDKPECIVDYSGDEPKIEELYAKGMEIFDE